ncbi:DUF393 domain-containing protein [Rhizobiaceae bacterium]|nr:DUF393 domain-containing protein [Rhizobiaceae bacterium]
MTTVIKGEVEQGITVVYDGECPFCSRYATMLRLRRSFGPVRLVDARSDDPTALQARRLFDLDEGMAALIAGHWYHGADCVHVLALASGQTTWANWLIGAIFANSRRASILYPFLRFGRNASLALLGRKKLGKAALTPQPVSRRSEDQ